MSELNFDAAEYPDQPESELIALAMLKATLAFPVSDAQVKGVKLAADIRFCNEEPIADTALLWFLVLDVASCIPPDHPAQASLVNAIHHLRTSEYTAAKDNMEWKDLPSFWMSVREKWDDIGCAASEDPEKDFPTFRNFTSFVARVTTLEYAPWMIILFAELRDTLEEPPAAGIKEDRRIWVVTEWLIHCSPVLYANLSPVSTPDADTARAFRLGSRCVNSGGQFPVFSVQRWEHWKERLSELTSAAEELQLSDESLARIQLALEAMMKAEADAADK
ncbi:hypothetical protein Micbo1qcDRAFT_234486 [Microdochium bolleyi]|uniref:Uncharacterized protein n=1 Tax=Microdochium bolleyi TaxID=196109 RepID=A0A136J014_9PEZI|nr:hypothetical protein Micbo1qcDRAFT_234486 [Microdochium bolleyi]